MGREGGEGEGERERERETDRQTDRETDIQTDRQRQRERDPKRQRYDGKSEHFLEQFKLYHITNDNNSYFIIQSSK